MTVTYRRIPSTDPRLGRHVRHDSRSRDYAYPTAGLTLVSTKHARRIPVLDQGNLGSCTGNAGIGCMGTDPYYSTISLPTLIRTSQKMNPQEVDELVTAFQEAQKTRGVMVLPPGADVQPARTLAYSLDEAGAVALYSKATQLDDYPGQYPPTDTGSDGLSVAKALQAAGEISGYQHTFTLNDALLALTQTPVITGVNWYEAMFNPDADGRLHPTGAVAGGHEFVVDEIDVENKRVWMTNSWGASWGVQGRAYLTWDDWGTLLGQQGDVTVFTPLTAPAPTPTPPVPPAPPAPGPWRVGNHLGRTIYRGNHFEGILETRALAQQVVDLLNAQEA